jgi:hypothetical protein
MSEAEVLERVLEQARTVPVEALPALIGQLATANAVAFSRLQSPAPPRQEDRMLNTRQAAERLNVSEAYLRHHPELPFIRRVGRKVLYSSGAIQKFIEQRR